MSIEQANDDADTVAFMLHGQLDVMFKERKIKPAAILNLIARLLVQVCMVYELQGIPERYILAKFGEALERETYRV